MLDLDKRIRRFLLPVICCALLVGCGSDDDAPDEPPVSTPTIDLPDPEPTTSASPTDEATPEADPTEALEAEIQEFFEEFIAVSYESWTSLGALQARREMFADSCGSCLAGYELARRAHDEGLTLEADPTVVERVRLHRMDESEVTFSAFTTSSSGTLVNQEGDVVQEFKSTENLQVIYQARKSGDSWIIVKDDVAP